MASPSQNDDLGQLSLKVSPLHPFAVMHDGSQLFTWRSFILARNRIANNLAAKGVKPGHHAAIFGKNSPDWLLARAVCSLLGVRVTPVNWHLVATEVEFMVNHSDSDVLFFDTVFLPTVLAIYSKLTPVGWWVQMQVPTAEDSSGVGKTPPLVPFCPPERLFDIRQLRMHGSAAFPECPAGTDKIGGNMLYTGGTTGKPKGAVRLAMPLPLAFLATAGFDRSAERHVQLLCAPLYHAMPFIWSAIAINLKGTMVLMKHFDAAAACRAIEAYQVNSIFLPPILVKRLMMLPQSDPAAQLDLSSLKQVVVAGAPTPPETKLAFLKRFGPILFEVYGSSECHVVTVACPSDMVKKPRSCGKAVPGVEILLLDEKKQPVTTPGTPGELYAKGRNIVHYYKGPENDPDLYGPQKEWRTVGDVAYLDSEGYLYITDRKADMILSGGVNIYPAEIEDVLHQHPAIADCAVFGVPDEMYGERVHAALLLAAGHTLTAEELQQWCKGKLAGYKIPKAADISFHSEFPRSEAGKLFKRKLREKFWAGRASKL